MSTVVRKTSRIGVPRAASEQPSGNVSFRTKKETGSKAAVKKPAVQGAASHILSAPRGARTLTHREIKQAVDRVFVKRYGAGA